MFANWAQCYFKAKEVIGSGVLVPVRIQLLREMDVCLPENEELRERPVCLACMWTMYKIWSVVLGTECRHKRSIFKYCLQYNVDFLFSLHLGKLIGFNMKNVFRTDAYVIIYSVFKSTFISVLYQLFLNWVQWIVPTNSENCTTCHLVFCP